MTIVSIVQAPEARSSFGRLQLPYPASPASHPAPAPVSAVRAKELLDSALRAAALGQRASAEQFGSPFTPWVAAGASVFILPNLVMHRRSDERALDFFAKCTNAQVLTAVARAAIEATGTPSSVTIGNAPLQGCNHSQMLSDIGILEALEDFPQELGSSLIPRDLRQVISQWTRFGALRARVDRGSESAIAVDLGRDSLLEPLYRRGSSPAFRVADYPASTTMSFHAPGRHVYIVHRTILKADVIISVPKLKTHQKVGVTCALKGTVGSVAKKECLAHHRKGGPRQGGDEYDRDTLLRLAASNFADRVAGRGLRFSDNVERVFSKVLYRIARSTPHSTMGGAWYGNDTAWRMSLDVARVLRYARLDGTLSDAPVRQHLALVDGLVAGEGDGPLRPSARNLGVLLFGDDVCAVDAACALAMGFDPERIPIIRNAFGSMRYPLTNCELRDIAYSVDGTPIAAEEIPRFFSPPFRPPRGWRGHVEFGEVSSHGAGRGD